jgi:hypothetical protein
MKLLALNIQSFLSCLAGAALFAGDASSLAQSATFTSVTDGDLVNDAGIFTGCAWGDFNNDGQPDVFVCNYGNIDSLYLNNSGGTFSRVAQSDLSADTQAHLCATAADYDDDGKLDLAVAAGGFADTAEGIRLYHNNGDGTFQPITGGALGGQSGFFWAATWVDYDNDGFLDLFVTNEGDPKSGGGRNLLLHGHGDGTFDRVAAGAIATDVTASRCALWADYDNDGFVDLVVINAKPSHNFLYHNNGDGTFTKILTNAIATDTWPAGALHGAWGDYDNDGLPDLFVTDLSGQANRLYHNDGQGVFTTVPSAPMISPTLPKGAYANGASWGDYDNDGFLDLFVTFVGAPNALFHNQGDGTFVQVLDGDPVQDGGPGIFADSCAWVDYDGDGFLDLFVTRNTQGQSPIGNLLYHNNGNANHWLEVNLLGTVSNRFALGAKVRVQTTVSGKILRQVREISTGGGWNVMPLGAHFGLGDATNIDLIRIEWPSGTVQELQNQTPNALLSITEPPRLNASISGGQAQISVRGGRSLSYQVENSADLANWSPLTTLTVTNLNRIGMIIDPLPVNSHPRFYRARLK